MRKQERRDTPKETIVDMTPAQEGSENNLKPGEPPDKSQIIMHNLHEKGLNELFSRRKEVTTMNEKSIENCAARGIKKLSGTQEEENSIQSMPESSKSKGNVNREAKSKEETIKPQEWNNMTPQEVVDRLNHNSPHMNARLGRKGDEELSEMLIHSVPRSTQSKKNMPKKRSKSTIYYRVSPANDALVFAWKESAEYISKIHNALKAKTWGELKKKLPPEEYDWIIDARSNYTSYREKPRLKSSDPFCAYDDVPGYADGDYPTWLQQEQEFCLPNEILYKYATHKCTTLNGDYYRIEKEHEEAICRDLRALGFNVIKRDDIYFY